MNRLQGKVALITGAGSGIGEASALLFADEGAKVAVAEISTLRGTETAHAIEKKGGKAIFIKTDVKDEQSVKSSIRSAIAHFGRLDIIYCNAGYSVADDGPITEVSLEGWEETQKTNLFGAFLCCKFGIPELLKVGAGSIILTSSIFALRGWDRSAYTAAKGALISLTRIMAVDYGKYKIRVNCICPGVILTNAVKMQFETNPVVCKSLREFHLLGFGEPSDVAYMALFLASEESRLVTGAVIPVDSGFSATGRSIL